MNSSSKSSDIRNDFSKGARTCLSKPHRPHARSVGCASSPSLHCPSGGPALLPGVPALPVPATDHQAADLAPRIAEDEGQEGVSTSQEPELLGFPEHRCINEHGEMCPRTGSTGQPFSKQQDFHGFGVARIRALEGKENLQVKSILAVGPVTGVRHHCNQFRALAFYWGLTMTAQVPEIAHCKARPSSALETCNKTGIKASYTTESS